MKKISTVLFVILVLTFFLSINVQAKKVKYIATDYRFNFVKLVQLKPKEAAKLNAKHPYTIDEKALAEGLKLLIVNKKHLMKEEISELEIFNDSSVSFLSQNIARALKEASPSEEIWFSYLVKTPIVIIRNDRLTSGKVWMEEDGLHIEFNLLKSPIFGDTSKRGYESKVIKKKQGARLSLGYGDCQSAGSVVDEIVLNMDCCAEKLNSEKTTEVTEIKKIKAELKEMEKTPLPEKTAEERLQELEDLKAKNLISSKEYKSLRKEILKDLKK